MKLKIDDVKVLPTKNGSDFLLITSGKAEYYVFDEKLFETIQNAAINKEELEVEYREWQKKDKNGKYNQAWVITSFGYKQEKIIGTQQRIEKFVKEKRDNINWLNARTAATNLILEVYKKNAITYHEIESEIKKWTEIISKIGFENGNNENHS